MLDHPGVTVKRDSANPLVDVPLQGHQSSYLQFSATGLVSGNFALDDPD
jgi:hypothetical protein